MATKTAVRLSTGTNIQPKSPVQGLIPATGIWSAGAGLSLSSGDVIQMVKVAQGCTLVYFALSGGSGDALVSLGDGVSDTRYLAYATMSSAQPSVRTITLHASNVPYVYSTDDTIDIFVSTASVGTITGGFHLTCIFARDF